MDMNARSNLKKAIQTGTQVYLIFFEMYLKPNIAYNNIGISSEININFNKITFTDELKIIVDKHNKIVRSFKFSNESYYFYCKNENEQLNKLIDSFGNIVKLMFK